MPPKIAVASNRKKCKHDQRSGKQKSEAKSGGGYKFKIGEKILCYDGPHLYEAKCLNAKKPTPESPAIYLVHYANFNSLSDEWVEQRRMLKYNEKNLRLQQELRQKAKAKISKAARRDADPNYGSESDAKKEKKKSKLAKTNSGENDAISSAASATASLSKLITPRHICKQDQFLGMQEVKIRIPEDLKTILVDDWELITNQQKLLPLPTKLNVDKILSDYFFHKTQASKLPSNHSIDGYRNFLSNIRRYFNCLLEQHLLYESEQPQRAYLAANFDSLIRGLRDSRNENPSKPAGNHKDSSKRAWRKLKKAKRQKTQQQQQIVSQISASTTDDPVSIKGSGSEVASDQPIRSNNSNTETEPLLLLDSNSQQSQGEASNHSGTSNETSSTATTTTTNTTAASETHNDNNNPNSNNNNNNNNIPKQNQNGDEDKIHVSMKLDCQTAIGMKRSIETITGSNASGDGDDECMKLSLDYTKLYGGIHLLRLFTRLGHFLFYTDLDEERLALLNSYIHDFLKYLSKNLSLFWNYTDASYIEADHFMVCNGQQQSTATSISDSVSIVVAQTNF